MSSDVLDTTIDNLKFVNRKISQHEVDSENIETMNQVLNTEGSTDYSTPRKTRPHNTKSSNKLPKDFHQRIVEIENKFVNVKTMDMVHEILYLYKVYSIIILVRCRVLFR